ncbi:MAG: hypothetical protein ACR5K7_06275 [Symbiopectobacterium sp.]
MGRLPALVQLAAASAGNVCLPLTELHPNFLFDGRDPVLAYALWNLAELPDSTACGSVG